MFEPSECSPLSRALQTMRNRGFHVIIGKLEKILDKNINIIN